MSEVYEEIFENAREMRYANLLRRAVKRFPEEEETLRIQKILDWVISMYFD
ncbi:hypothetical protein [Collinsella stercoris]|uniref:hypothetical protein n=1 Tax=Collinsella stercoris TaxID=147206 RepID=UPI003AEF350A